MILPSLMTRLLLFNFFHDAKNTEQTDFARTLGKSQIVGADGDPVKLGIEVGWKLVVLQTPQQVGSGEP